MSWLCQQTLDISLVLQRYLLRILYFINICFISNKFLDKDDVIWVVTSWREKKPDYGAQIGVPGSVSNWDSSSTLQVELRTRAPSVYQCCTLDQYVFSRSETTRRIAIRALFCDICLCFGQYESRGLL